MNSVVRLCIGLRRDLGSPRPLTSCSTLTLTGCRMNRSLKVRSCFHFSSSSCWCTNILAHGAELYLTDFRGWSTNNMYKVMCLDYSHDGVESLSWQNLSRLLSELHHFRGSLTLNVNFSHFDFHLLPLTISCKDKRLDQGSIHV